MASINLCKSCIVCSMITAESLLKAIDARRLELGTDGASITLVEAAAEIGVHSAIFSRLKRGMMPSAASIQKLAAWVGDEKALHCETCSEFDTEDGDEDAPRGGAIVALLPAESDPVWAASSEEPSAHMTTIWMGEASELADPAALIDEVKLIAGEFEPFSAKVTSRGELGDDSADVLFLEPEQTAFDIRDALLDEGTAVRAAHDAVEQYPEWTPHVTLGYADAPALTDYEVDDDTAIQFDRIAVWLGGEYTTFDLGGGSEQQVRAVFARGKLSESEDPETQAAITRAKELLREGAIGVSVALDVHPDDVGTLAEAERKAAADDWEKPLDEYLPEGFTPRNRVRHTAMVGTPAFADARLELLEDGVTVEGIVTFEGEWTGDMRFTHAIDLESSRVPSPILYNRDAEGHEGPTIGYLESFEWVDRPASSHRPVLDDEAITASIKPMEFPAAYFAQTVPTGPEPLRISAADAQGFRAIRGLAAPKGVCHRSSMACWTWPGDMDSQHRHFHTGTLLGLDNGENIRVGALTMGGAHLDPVLAKQGVKASSVGSYREDANRVFALVRVWETRFGLMLAGVIPPDVSDGDVARALACSPSIEFWPERGSRTLVGLHLVPTPALPVLASMGDAEIVVTDEAIQIEEPITLEAESGDEPAPLTPIEPEQFGEVLASLSQTLDALLDVVKVVPDALALLDERIDGVQRTTGHILSLTPIDDIVLPE